MAKKIRFPLKMKNGAEVRTLDELKASFDLESVLGYFTDGRLSTWLADRYYDEKAEAVAALSKDLPDLNVKICEILEVDYKAEDESADLEYIQRRNEKYKILSAAIDDQEVLGNMDIVAMDQNELYDILDESPEKVYLYGEKFEIPFGRKNIRYVGLNNPLVIIDKNKYANDFEEARITFSNVIFEEGALKIRYPDPIGEFEIENSVLKKGVPNSEGVCIIPYGVTSIGNSAFWGCKELIIVTLPDSITSIENGAFYGCVSLKAIDIPKHVTSIGRNAFGNCESINSIVIPEGVTSIEEYTFWSCKNLSSIIIPESVKSIGDCAFHECENITYIKIPDNVKSIGDSAFSKCSGLINIDMPKNLKTIGANAFSRCVSLKSMIIPDGVEAIEPFTFEDCNSLTSITIPDSVKRIETRGNFGSAESLTNVIIANHFSQTELRDVFGYTPWGKARHLGKL